MLCVECSEEFTKIHVKQKFCSRSCSASFNNRAKPKRNKSDKASMDCQQCRKNFLYNRSQNIKSARRFCSTECSHENARIVRESMSHYNSDQGARADLLRKFGTRCAICERSEWNGQPMPVVCDHFDGDSTNMLTTNFRLLCCNCDALTEFYKARNKGRGRHSRRERYHSGKSF